MALNTATILAALDGGVLDPAAAVRKLCEAVDNQGAVLHDARQNLLAAIETMKGIDALLARPDSWVPGGALTAPASQELLQLVCAAMGEASTACAGQTELIKRDECARLAQQQADAASMAEAVLRDAGQKA